MKVLDLKKVKDLTNEKLEKIAQEKNKYYKKGTYNVSLNECVNYARDFVTESEDVKAFREDIYKIPFIRGCWFLLNHNSIVIEVELKANNIRVETKVFDFITIKCKATSFTERMLNKVPCDYRVESIDLKSSFDGFADIKEEVKKISNEIAKEINDKTIEFYSLLKEYGINLEQLGNINDYIDKNKQYIDFVKINKKMKGEN